MTTVNGLTAERMLEIEAASIVNGTVNGSGHLILTKHDNSTIDSGSVIGPTGSPGVTQGQLDTFMSDHLPIGSIVDYIGTSAPNAKWLGMTGQTVVGGQSAYTVLWSRIPTVMKSNSGAGPDIIMPHTEGKISVGYNSADTDFDWIGQNRGSVGTGGTKTQTLTQANLPNATITIDPPNTVVSVDPINTSVYIDPPATAVTGSTGTEPDHQHLTVNPVWYNSGDGRLVSAGAGLGAANLQIGGNSYGQLPVGVGTGSAGAHNHGAGTLQVDIPAFNGAVDIAAFDINVNIAQFNSGPLGSGTAHNNLQPYITFMKIIKVL